MLQNFGAKKILDVPGQKRLNISFPANLITRQFNENPRKLRSLRGNDVGRRRTFAFYRCNGSMGQRTEGRKRKKTRFFRSSLAVVAAKCSLDAGGAAVFIPHSGGVTSKQLPVDVTRASFFLCFTIPRRPKLRAPTRGYHAFPFNASLCCERAHTYSRKCARVSRVVFTLLTRQNFQEVSGEWPRT